MPQTQSLTHQKTKEPAEPCGKRFWPTAFPAQILKDEVPSTSKFYGLFSQSLEKSLKNGNLIVTFTLPDSSHSYNKKA